MKWIPSEQQQNILTIPSISTAIRKLGTVNVKLTSTYSRKFKSIGINLPLTNEFTTDKRARYNHLLPAVMVVSVPCLFTPEYISVNLFTNHLKVLKSSE